MKPYKTKHLVKAFQVVFPYMTADMIREAVEAGKIKAVRNPLVDKGDYFFRGEDIVEFLKTCPHIEATQAREVIKYLGINNQQLKIHGVAC